MLYGIEGFLNGKLFGNGEGGSSGGGITLPELTNPAGADQILEGYEAIDGEGNKVTGTHVCESGGGETAIFTDLYGATVSAYSASSAMQTSWVECPYRATWTTFWGYLQDAPSILVCVRDYSVGANSFYGLRVYNTADTNFAFTSGTKYTIVITHVDA